MKHIIFYIVVSILFVSVFSCKQRKNMQYLPFFYMKNYEVMHSKKYISIRENEYSDSAAVISAFPNEKDGLRNITAERKIYGNIILAKIN